MKKAHRIILVLQIVFKPLGIYNYQNCEKPDINFYCLQGKPVVFFMQRNIENMKF